MSASQPKEFNTTGPCDPLDHYMLPALPRLPEVQDLVNSEEYFVLHAPRQSGKTTSIYAAVDQINAEEKYYALSCSLARLNKVTDKGEAMSSIIGLIYGALRNAKFLGLKKTFVDGALASISQDPDFKESPIQLWLNFLSERIKKDLVIFFDEADCLTEQPLISFLSQLRDGFIERSRVPFPRSIALIGMRNIRYYTAQIRPDSQTLGSGSPFNVIAKALTLANFTQEEIKALYGQRAAATGQVFLDEAVQRAYYWSEGQPWLVNALAREVVEEILRKDYGPTITAGLIDQAADNLMRRQDPHMDSLFNRLSEPRVKRFVEPMLALSLDSALNSKKPEETLEAFNDDLQYCLDLGLLKKDGKLRPANPIYANAMVRYLNKNIQDALPSDLIGKWMDGQNLDLSGLLEAFQQYWALNSERFLKGASYTEGAPHYYLAAFLQRVVNGGATLINEFADGLGYGDILIQYAGKSYVIATKIKDNEISRAKSLEQTLRYMDGFLVNEGWLVVFDRKSEKSWKDKITWDTKIMPNGETIHVVGC